MSRSSSRGFFSRFRRHSSSHTDDDIEDNETFKTRDEGANAGVFTCPTNIASTPKYIWVHAHKKRNREFTRMFLAQELSGFSDKPSRFSHRRSSSTDSKPTIRSDSTDSADHKKAIWCAKFSPDGQFLATAGADCIIRIWKVLTSPAEHQLFDSNDAVDDDDELTRQTSLRANSLTTYLSASSQSSATRSPKRSLSRKDSRNSKKQQVSAPVFVPYPVLEYFGHTQDILDLCWSKNNFLLSSSMDKTVKLWHPKFTQSIKTFVHNDFVTSIAFHPLDDRFFVSGSLDCRVRLWSITENKVEYHRDAPDFVMAVTFSPDGETVVAGCFGGQCIFYETTGLRQKSQMTVKSSTRKKATGSRITGIQILQVPAVYPVPDNSPNAATNETPSTNNVKMLISTSDSRIRMFDFQDKTLDVEYKGHSACQGQIHASFSDNCEYIISGSEDNKTYIWRPNGEPGSVHTKSRDSYEYFQSNKAIVSVALFAPLASRVLLYNARDPIYDLAAPCSVLLNSSTVASSSSSSEGELAVEQVLPEELQTNVGAINPNPSDGNIIITCDQDGVIKVFRQDSAYDRRKLVSDTICSKKKK